MKMDHLIYKLPSQLDIYDSDFIKDLHEFYSDEIVCPKCDKNKLIEKLNTCYSLEPAEKKYIDYLLRGISTDSIRSGEVWVLHQTEQSSKFYKYFTQRFQDGGPILFAYLDDTDIFISNCSMFEVYISCLRGVDNIDIKDSEYKSYLNNIYLYNCCLREFCGVMECGRGDRT